MSLAPIASQSSAASVDPAAALAGQATSGADIEQRFLKLLVTQLNNQDPLNPLQNSELTSQLAQLSTVSGIEKLNTALQSLVSQSGAGQALQAASLIGRTVLAPGQALAGGGPAPYAVSLPGSADAVQVYISDAGGRVVRSYDLGTLPRGVHELAWDGKNDAGQAMAPGRYHLEVVATSGATRLDAASLVYAQVSSVAQDAGSVSLDLASGERIALADVKVIR